MNLYLVSQNINNGYDTWDSMVVVAESEEDARLIHPYAGKADLGFDFPEDFSTFPGDGWVKKSEIDQLEVEFLGETNKERGVICASFNAG